MTNHTFMKKNVLILLSILIVSSLYAQKDYFQQNVNYKINVTLDDKKHELNGDIEIQYTNNSPTILNEIYFHLWPNAFSSTETAFAKQKYDQGNTRFLFSNPEDRGHIKALDFAVNGEKLTWNLDEKDPDIALVKLNDPLASGATITIKTPFSVKIPKSFSRLGHVKTSYQLTQWYPKPAVYDRDGWHPMPYLDQGEFYSEFGSFDVTITLPDNYVVGATGVLQTEKEVDFLEKRIEITNAKIEENKINYKEDYPASSDITKTIQYKAENVHDFAWFADKRFYVQKDQVELNSGKKVDTWVMFTYQEGQIWKDAVEYVNRSVKYYSDRIGEYPYPHATAVQSALSAGAGMEYPMITVIGLSGNAKSLDRVITHEVGHNWFYGILGSNERMHTWMDEGFNSFYENAYMKEFYKSNGQIGDEVPAPFDKILSSDEKKQNLGYLMFLMQQRRGEFIEPSSDANKMTSINYGTLGYAYPALLFKYAEAYLGQDEFDRIMQIYFDEWQFKHPSPKEATAIFERETKKSFGWLFNDLLASRKELDYAVKSANESNGGVLIKVVNKGKIAAPFSISALKDGKITKTQWYEGFFGTKEVVFPTVDEGYRIDALGVMPEVNRRNNYIKSKGIFKKAEKIQLKLIGGLETGERNKLYVAPALGFNLHDGFMLGASFYNGGIPQKKIEYNLTPMYGFGSKKAVGMGSIDYFMFPKSDKFRSVNIGLTARTFSKFDNSDRDYAERYLRITPRAELKFKPSATSTTSSFLRVKGSLIQNQEAISGINGVEDFAYTERMVYELSYELKNERKMHPYSFKTSLVGNSYEKGGVGQSDTRLLTEFNYKLNYHKKPKKGVALRLFSGQFLANSDKDFSRFPITLTGQGSSDYFYEDWFFGRGKFTGFGTQQMNMTQGGFKTPLETAHNVGQTNSTMISMNLTIDAPMKFLPISAFIDYAYFQDTRPTVDAAKSFYSAGLKYSLFDGFLNIYYPFFGSDELMNAYKEDRSIIERFSFSINLKGANPLQALRARM